MSVGEVTVVLSRNDNCGFGFSLLGHPGLPPIIYDILEDSPAADCGQIEVGDVILSVNECDVSRYNTKEVLKCLRLSSDPVTLKLRRDPFIKSCVQEQLSVMCSDDETNGQHESCYEHPYYYNNTGDGNGGSDNTFVLDNSGGSNGSHTERPKFEAYMMTGEHILNLSRLQQTAITQYQKTVDSLWNCRVIKVPKSVPNSPTSDLNSTVKSTVINNRISSISGNGDTKITNQEKSNCDKNSMSYEPDDMNRSPSPPLAPNGERIVWTYNAPVSVASEYQTKHPLNYQSSTSLPSVSPTSPTSISSSVMSDTIPRLHSLNGINQQNGGGIGSGCNADLSMSETILSPDYQDMETIEILNNRELLMDFSDHSDSDSTLLASDSQPINRRMRRSTSPECDYKIIIQVKASDKDLKKKNKDGSNESSVNDAQKQGYREFRNNDDDDSLKYCTSPPSEDDSDVESLHSFHYSPKAVDIPSAVRLAKRLFMLDGFKKSDVSRHLSKNNEFSRVVAEEYLKYFSFESETLDLSLRKFLNQFCLTGETQERERVLVHFSKRYLDCNPDGTYNSQDAVHTLTCAIMLLNTDLHDPSVGHKMTCSEFVENLVGLNEGADFPKSMLKMLYQAIKSHPIEWPVDDDNDDQIAFLTNSGTNGKNNGNQEINDDEHVNITKKIDSELNKNILANAVNGAGIGGSNSSPFVEYKQSYVMRKCCLGASGKKISFHKRRWKMMFCTLRDLTLYMHKDEKTYQTFCKKNANQSVSGSNQNHLCHLDNNSAVRVHHALASRAEDYTKKQNVFRLQTADRAEYLFQTSDGKELESWIETLNFVAASFSAHPLEPPVSSKNKFERPFLSFGITKLSLKEQLKDHDDRVDNLQLEFENHRKNRPDKNAKSRVVLNYAEKEKYLLFEINRYKTYGHLMRSRLSQYREFNVSPKIVHESKKTNRDDLNAVVNNNNNNSLIIENDLKEINNTNVMNTTRRSPPMPQNRYSYQQAMCR